MTVSADGRMRARSRRGGGLAVTVGGGGNSTGTAGLGGGAEDSPGGSGNFQPVVLTVSDNGPRDRAQGGSPSRRPARVVTASGATKRGNSTTPSVSPRSTAATSAAPHGLASA